MRKEKPEKKRYKKEELDDFYKATENGEIKKVSDMLIKDSSLSVRQRWEAEEIGTMMHAAVKSNDPEMILLVAHNAIQFYEIDKETPGDRASMAFKSRIHFHGMDADHNTPLHIAIQNKAERSAAMLLLLGANPNQQNAKGQTPLHDAVLAEDVELVKLLMRAGANDRIEDKQGNSPFSLANEIKNKEITKALLTTPEQNTNPESNFFFKNATAIKASSPNFIGKYAFANEFIYNRMPLDLKDETGNTQLHLALLNNNVALASDLLRKIDVTIRNDDGQSAFDIANKSTDKNMKSIERRIQGKLSRSLSRVVREAIENEFETVNMAEIEKLIEAGADGNKALMTMGRHSTNEIKEQAVSGNDKASKVYEMLKGEKPKQKVPRGAAAMVKKKGNKSDTPTPEEEGSQMKTGKPFTPK